MRNLKFLISYSYLKTCWVFVAVAHSPLTLANQMTTSVGDLSEHNQDMAFEGNATLQKLVGAKYGVNISGLLDFFSHENDTDTDVSGPYYDSTPPEWQPKLLKHLVKEQIRKSNKTLKLTPKTFVDDGKWYLEFSIQIKSMTLNDEVSCHFINTRKHSYRANPARYRERERKRRDNFTFWLRRALQWYMNGTDLYCKGEFHINGTKREVYSETIPIVFQTVIEDPHNGNGHGPFVRPSAPVIMYNTPTLVQLDCWAWLRFNETVIWYLIQGNNKEEIAPLKQNYEQSHVKVKLSKMFDSSDNGSVMVCEVAVDPERRSMYEPAQNITLLYGSIDDNPKLKQTTEFDNQEMEQSTDSDNQEVKQQTEFATDECKNVVMLGWGMLALLALSAVAALATCIVHGAIEPDKKNPQTEDRTLPNASTVASPAPPQPANYCNQSFVSESPVVHNHHVAAARNQLPANGNKIPWLKPKTKMKIPTAERRPAIVPFVLSEELLTGFLY